jgi:PAS domain S-box-containing protein
VQALSSPQYVVAEAGDLDSAIRILSSRKIEVLLLEPEAGRTRSRAALANLRAVEADLAILLVVPRLTLVATVAAMRDDAGPTPVFDFIGTPVSGPELVRSLERVREVRYLRRSEERGRRAEARMTAVMQSVPYAVLSLDERGTVHDWNPGASTIFGWSVAEAVGRCFWDLAFAAGQPAIEGKLPPRDDPAPVRLEVQGRRRDGREFPAVMALARVPMAGQAMFCAILEDVGEARRMEVELRLAQKLEAVGRLAAGLAHEINTPCQFVALNASFLGDSFSELEAALGRYEQLGAVVAGHPSSAALLEQIAQAEDAGDLKYLRERTPQAVEAIHEGARRIAALVAAMKQFAQPDVDGPSTIDINRALESTLTVLHHQASGVGEIERRFGDVPTITGLAGDLNQALLSIVLNAIQALEDRKQHTDEPGRILVETRSIAQGAAVEVAISDNGPGIPEAIRGRIFDPFFTTREVGRGVGQGLTVARSIIVDRHGGTLTFDSEIGVKTTFYVRLPVAGEALRARG